MTKKERYRLEKHAKIKALRQQFANLNESEKQALINRGIIATVEGRALSIHNTMLLYLQSNGTSPSVVGGYQQWLKAGRQVSKGQHGFMILIPTGNKDDDRDIIEEVRFLTATVFDISQTELINDTKPTPTPTPTPEDNNIMKGWAIV